ncbi:MAG: alpha/beta hydrolase [Pseudomonadota bacterium]
MKKFERAVTSQDGTRLHVTGFGETVHPPVLLLHGGGQTGWSWRKTAHSLVQQEWQCLVPDLRGHGKSAFADGYQLDHFAADVGYVTDQLCKTPPVAVGASLGGVSALMAQAERPMLRALVLVDIVPDWESNGIEQIIAFLKSYPEGFASVDEAQQAIAKYLPHRSRPADATGLKNNLRQRNGRWHWHWDPKLLAAVTQHVAQWPERITRACRSISIPTLLISGERSEVVSERGAKRLLELIPHAQHVVIKDAHHMVAGDSNQPFTAAVLDFLRTLTGTDYRNEDSLCLA